MVFKTSWIAVLAACLWVPAAFGQTTPPRFRVMAFYTGMADAAHISFVNEARPWFARMAAEHHFSFESTTNWDNLNLEFLAPYRVILFLDTRRTRRDSERHSRSTWKTAAAGWAFTSPRSRSLPRSIPRTGTGITTSSWEPACTLAIPGDPHRQSSGWRTRSTPRPSACRPLSRAPNEWYKWANDLRTNRNIKILAAIDPASFPLGTGPKPHEIWHDGYYPVVWTNQKYRMIYFNMGHNDMDYGTRPSKELSSTFANEVQNRLILNALEWLGTGEKPQRPPGK